MRVLQLHTRTVAQTVEVMSQVSLADLDRPIPVPALDVRRVYSHLIGLNYGFAAAVEGEGHDASRFAPPALHDPVRQFAESADVVVRAFAGPVPETVQLAPVAGEHVLLFETAVTFHILDSVIHGWDVAKAIGVPTNYDEDVVAEALRVTLTIPEQAKSAELTALFRPRVPTASSDPLDQVAALLGRSPDWTAGPR